MQTSAGLIAVALLLALTNSSKAFAEDLGVVGRTWPVAEESLLDVMADQLQASIDDGRWQNMVDAGRESSRAYVDQPPGQVLPVAEAASTRLYDPSVVIPEAIVDHQGRVLFPAGTRINPLDVRPLNRTLMFFDADDAVQVEWAYHYLNTTERPVVVPVLVNGSPTELINAWQRPVYFDQRAYLTGQFGIRAVPSLVYQKMPQDRYLTIEEVKP